MTAPAIDTVRASTFFALEDIMRPLLFEVVPLHFDIDLSEAVRNTHR